jgi:phage tail protein X
VLFLQTTEAPHHTRTTSSVYAFLSASPLLDNEGGILPQGFSLSIPYDALYARLSLCE